MARRDAVRIFRPTWHRFQSHWYFVDHSGTKLPCRSGYEALFATFLVSKAVPFEYEALALGITGKALYLPDFFLPSKGEFVELKGRPGGNGNQEKAIALLRRKGFVIRVMDWNALRATIASPYLHYKSFFDGARAQNKSVQDFIAAGTWLLKRQNRAAAK
jgi:hypothetical protein